MKAQSGRNHLGKAPASGQQNLPASPLLALASDLAAWLGSYNRCIMLFERERSNARYTPHHHFPSLQIAEVSTGPERGLIGITSRPGRSSPARCLVHGTAISRQI